MIERHDPHSELSGLLAQKVRRQAVYVAQSYRDPQKTKEEARLLVSAACAKIESTASFPHGIGHRAQREELAKLLRQLPDNARSFVSWATQTCFFANEEQARRMAIIVSPESIGPFERFVEITAARIIQPVASEPDMLYAPLKGAVIIANEAVAEEFKPAPMPRPRRARKPGL